MTDRTPDDNPTRPLSIRHGANHGHLALTPHPAELRDRPTEGARPAARPLTADGES
nr:hypothetical protein KPHV_28960 [Kitasatospora purpeofusca]